MKLNDRITFRLPLYVVLGLAAAVTLVAVLAYAMTRKGSEVSSADYRRYEDVAADNEFIRGPIAAALADDGVITTDEAAVLDRRIRTMAQGSYQVTGDARVELERKIVNTPSPAG